MSTSAVPADAVSPAPPTPAESVGVVIRTRDRPLFLARALATVAGQTWTNWRVALVNDGGAPEPVEAAVAALRPDAAARVQVIHSGGIGRSEAFNAGLTALETGFVCCLDDDDSWTDDFLASLIGFWRGTHAETPDLGGVMTLVAARREDIEDLPDGTRRIVPLGEDWLPNSFRRTDFFINPIAYATYRQDLYPVQWMLRRDAVVQAGGFPAQFDVMEDRAFLTRFLQHWQLAVLDRTLAFHHRRVKRQSDTGRSVELNTLDNPSYDWRKFAELARPGTHGPGGDLAGLIRATAGTVVKELNDETSALWHKINGESQTLNRRLDQIEGRLGDSRAPDIQRPDPAHVAFDLWPALGTGAQGFALARGVSFARRFELSLSREVAGLLFHADPVARQFVVQIPQTDDWAAIEVPLDGLADPGSGLRVDMLLTSATGYLFETALSLRQRDGLRGARHSFAQTHVHACPASGSVHVTRSFAAADLTSGSQPKLSVILPRQARNFAFVCRDLVISRLSGGV